MVNAMLGEGFIKEHFFNRINDNIENPDKLARIWLETALAAYAKTKHVSRFASVDSQGKRWIIQSGKIVNDFKV